MMGGQNCHAEVVFDDGVAWLARFRLATTSSPPLEVRDYILRSEAATMTFLQHRTRIPTPKVFGWACESDPKNQLGTGYILMEKLHGKTLIWQAATPAQKEKIMQQLADIFLEIEKHPFQAIGSLVPSAEDAAEFVLHGLAHQATFRVRGGGGPLGPFSTASESVTAIIQSYLGMIVNGEVGVRHPVDVYLAHRFRLDVVDSLWDRDRNAPEAQFFLKHPDDKGDHILVNDSFDIVGVIDWEWTCTAPMAEAFCSPCMMWPVGKFYSGSNELAPEESRLANILRERGRDDLARCVDGGRKAQRFLFALGPESESSDRETFASLFMGLRRAFNRGDQSWEQWRSSAIEEWKGDGLLQALLETERGEEQL